MSELEFNSPYLANYLQMVEDTESPRIFHIWQALYAVSCALGRRCHFPFGPLEIYPNQFILLVGTPGTRKSTVVSMGKKLIKGSTGVRFAPQDTAGQRQGLVAAMQGSSQAKEFLEAVEVAGSEDALQSISQLMDVTNQPEDEEAQFISEADKHHLAVVSGEFSRFIGQNNLQMLDFLATMWDGDDYEYQLKASRTELKNPLLNIIGCTTPTSIAHAMPPAAGGQGFLSRVILVYGARRYKRVPRPTVPPLERVDRVKNTLSEIYYKIAGGFSESDAARRKSEDFYNYELEIADSRFGFYAERRYTHLIKLSMVIAASRESQQIEVDDVEEAHRILRATERGMPEALGEFGMNPLAVVKQEILEELRSNLGPIPLNGVIAMFTRDARAQDIAEVLNDLKRSGHINMIQQASGEMIVSAKYSKGNVEDNMLELLSSSGESK